MFFVFVLLNFRKVTGGYFTQVTEPETQLSAFAFVRKLALGRRTHKSFPNPRIVKVKESQSWSTLSAMFTMNQIRIEPCILYTKDATILPLLRDKQ